MKFLSVIFTITFVSTFSYAQNFADLANSEFSSETSYKEAEPDVLKCANYLFNTPADKGQINRLNSIQYIIKWMSGTPDYSFEIGSEATDLTRGNDDLFALYMAAMSKVVLESPDDEISNEVIYDRSEKLLLDYCANESNNIRPSKKIKKMLKAKG